MGITLQNVRMFQSTYSASVIAAFEQRFPEDEARKNVTLVPLTHPQNITTYVDLFKQNLLNDMAIGKELGIRWMRSNRLDISYHLSVLQFIRLAYIGATMFSKAVEAMDKITEN